MTRFRCGQELDDLMINKLYGRHYNIRKIVVCPADQGHFGSSRTRIYLIMTLKGKVIEVANVEEMYRSVSSYIKQKVQTKPSDYLVASLAELKAAKQAVADKRRKKTRVT